ncbi:MAG: L-2-amino-thiazoline-4-carboxylic acid hydrolase [Candidatus Lokiarchaeota archaeon]|nr:L-2-amino-thiazoline-4-carboxylic acid hydrolase [Candidatus Lokiarchaeota archaeon]
MPEKIVKDYYMKNKAKFMTQFDKFIHISKDLLVKQFNESQMEVIFDKMRKEYENLIPEIPYIGGRRNPFTSMLVDCVAMLAFFRTLENEGLSYGEIGEFNYGFWEKINKIRVHKLEKLGQNPIDQYFNETYLTFTKNLAKTSQLRKYPDDWVMEYVEGDGKTFDYGNKFTECGVHKVFKKLGAEKYVPFLCLTDFALGNVYGFGFTRTQTLGNGDPICDHTFLKKGTTPRAWPPDKLQEFKMKLE